MTWCGYAWATYRGERLQAMHECRTKHEEKNEDTIHMCSRCGAAPNIDTVASPVVDSVSDGPNTRGEKQMPKLDTATAKKVHQAEGGGSVLVDEDQYRVKLEKVIVSPKPDKNDHTYWIWTFSIVSGQTTGDKFKGKSVRTNTGWEENQHWYAKMLFDAFGVKANVDTDTILGKEIFSIITQGEITGGTRKGQIRNNMDTFMSLDSANDDGDWDDDGAEGQTEAKEAAAEDNEPDF